MIFTSHVHYHNKPHGWNSLSSLTVWRLSHYQVIPDEEKALLQKFSYTKKFAEYGLTPQI